jgi:SNF2 family DNA or RNA helicase
VNFWHDTARDLLVYDSPVVAKHAAQLQRARPLHNGFVALPPTLFNLQYLRYLNHPVVEPMTGYDWPGPFTPFTAQKVTANFLALHPRAFVLSDMGTGKTAAALWAADYVMQQYPAGTCRALVVAPLSTLQRVWADAIFQALLGRRTFVILHGTAEERVELLKKPHDFYIINFDGLGVGAPNKSGGDGRGLFKALLERPDIRMAIVDEASAYRDGTTKRHHVARRLLVPKDYLWMMTGTPTPNGPTDAHGLAKLVNNAHGEAFTRYKQRVMVQISPFKWMPRQGAMEEARKLLQPAVRFAIEDCVDLPPCTTQMRDVEFSAEQKKAYDTMRRDLVLSVKAGTVISAPSEAVLRLKLIQISCGAVYDAAHNVHFLDAGPRLRVLREVLEQISDKAIVFAPLTSVLQLLYKELKDWSREIINGEVGNKERNRIFAAFQQEEKPRLLIADPATMAHGLTLTAASTIVWFAPTDKTELYLQANKRIDRPGQKKATTIVQLASTATEREIYRRMANNESLQGVMLRMVREEGK